MKNAFSGHSCYARLETLHNFVKKASAPILPFLATPLYKNIHVDSMVLIKLLSAATSGD